LSKIIFERAQSKVKRPRIENVGVCHHQSRVHAGATGLSMLTKTRSKHPTADHGSGGQREKNKRDKLLRIKNAARELFILKGYDDTTTREIAIRAGVGMGTVFTYAENKRDLLFLIANEDLAETTARAASHVSPGAPMVSNLMAIFRDHYEFFLKQPGLSRLTLREMMFYESGTQANRFKATRELLISLVNEAVHHGKSRGEIASEEDHQLIGWVIFCVYQVELRRCLSETKPDLNGGMASLANALKVVIEGLAPRTRLRR
jgi:AcrR family transcriptional regulator